jgi:hypothetical protein
MTSGWLGLDWGNVPAWIGSTLTSGSLLIAATSYRRSVKDKEYDQASKIASWITTSAEPDETKPRLHVRNSSDGPIFETVVRVLDLPHVNIPELPPQTTSVHDLPESPTVARFFESNPTLTIEQEVVGVSMSVTLNREQVLASLRPSIQFRDAVGRRWKRGSDGKLQTAVPEALERTIRITKWPIVIERNASGTRVRFDLFPKTLSFLWHDLLRRKGGGSTLAEPVDKEH